MDYSKYSKYIDHTFLGQDATTEQIITLCDQAKKYKFYSVCVNPCNISLAKKCLEGSDVKVCAVVGFPLGQNTIATKIFETAEAIRLGADEIDMVINVPKLKGKYFDYCLLEINQIKDACENKVLKVIVETCLLSEEEKAFACDLVLKSDADFIKTSTGFSKAGATLEDIKLFKKILGNKKMIKAAGGISTSADLEKFIEAGADRIGTSRGVALVTGATINPTNKY